MVPPADTTTLKLESQVFFSFEAPPPYRINKGGYRIKLRLLPRVTPLPRSKVSKCASRCRVYIPSISRPFLSNYYRYIISFRSVFELGEGEKEFHGFPRTLLKKAFVFSSPPPRGRGGIRVAVVRTLFYIAWWWVVCCIACRGSIVLYFHGGGRQRADISARREKSRMIHSPRN